MINVLLITIPIVCIMAIVVLVPVSLYLFTIGFSVFELFFILSQPINTLAIYGLCIFTVLLTASIAGIVIALEEFYCSGKKQQ